MESKVRAAGMADCAKTKELNEPIVTLPECLRMDRMPFWERVNGRRSAKIIVLGNSEIMASGNSAATDKARSIIKALSSIRSDTTGAGDAIKELAAIIKAVVRAVHPPNPKQKIFRQTVQSIQSTQHMSRKPRSWLPWRSKSG
jgi:hypothetical protein